jgi:hypothetical protein
MKTIFFLFIISFLMLIYAPSLFVVLAALCGLVSIHGAKDRKYDKINWNNRDWN